jgi:putative membrane protein
MIGLLLVNLSHWNVVMSDDPKIDRQREHQANERTFLAWLRTSISLIAFGFAIARFGLFLRQLHLALTHQDTAVHTFTTSEGIGVSLVIFGIIVIAVSGLIYNQTFLQIERGNYRPKRFLVWMMVGAVIALGLFCIPLILENHTLPVTRPSSEHLPLKHSENN